MFEGELCEVKLRLTGRPPAPPTGTTGCPAPAAPPPEGGVELPGLGGAGVVTVAPLFEVGVGVLVTTGVGVLVAVGAVSGLAGTLVPPLQATSSAAVALAKKSFWRVFKKYFRSIVSSFAPREI
jgi:hypothetical protein